MDNRKKTKEIKQTDKYSKQWYLHHYIGTFARELDRLPDAARLRRDQAKAAPLSLLDLVF